jgi:Flp pilus assembly protein TadG
MSLLGLRERQGIRESAIIRVASFIAQSAMRLVRPFARSERGGTAVFFAFAIVPLIAVVGLATDATRGYFVKARLNQALDAAALAGGRVYASPNRDDDIRMYFKANFPDGYMGTVTTPLVITANDVEKTLTVTAQTTMPTTFMRLVNIDTMPVGTTSAVTIESQNVEVALVLDITGSMDDNGKIADLRNAANELIDIVVQDQQTPFYTKLSVVPYSQAVNVGAYAAQVRGAVAATHAITGATKANPVVVTSANHGFINGDKIVIAGVGGMTQINNNITASTTSTTQPQFWVVSNKTTNTFALHRNDGTNANGTSWGTYTANTGSISCTTPGCQYETFLNPSNAWKTYPLTTCVTERFGANAYTDAAPSTSPVGRNYPDPANPCVTNQIAPLSSDKATLHAKINGLTATGSTAGQIGTAWGWYMLSPNFAYLWPAASRPAAYGTPKLLKVAIIMTDGDYNTIYYNGVIAKDAASGSGSSSTHINHNSHNGTAYSQAEALCAAMKAPGIDIEIYTVGLGLVTQAAEDIMSHCATSAAHVYLPASGAEMKTAFKDIAMKISKLRLSK